MQDRIMKELRRIELEEQVRILYASEAGSRAWGFASSDSDYDIRFIYVHKPEWYLSIEKKRDVIEYPIDESLDINGWDLRKALQLMVKSNQGLIEWLNSPVVYTEALNGREKLLEAVKLYFSPKGCLHHYLSTAGQNYRDYLHGETVRVKKYLYVVRPLLACHWLENKKTIPPIEFDKLLKARGLEGELLREIESLVDRKRSGDRLGLGPRVELINQFVEKEMEYYKEYVKIIEEHDARDIQPLDNLFRALLKEAWDLQI